MALIFALMENMNLIPLISFIIGFMCLLGVLTSEFKLTPSIEKTLTDIGVFFFYIILAFKPTGDNSPFTAFVILIFIVIFGIRISFPKTI